MADEIKAVLIRVPSRLLDSMKLIAKGEKASVNATVIRALDTFVDAWIDDEKVAPLRPKGTKKLKVE